jgi:hypothetical protein
LGDCSREVRRVDNVVAIKHIAGLPPRQLHDLAFADTGFAEVARCCSAKVVEEPARDARLVARTSPHLPKVADRFAVPMKYVEAIADPPPLQKQLTELEGQTYSGFFRVDKGMVLVTSNFGEKWATLGDSPAELIAQIVMRELVESGKAK